MKKNRAAIEMEDKKRIAISDFERLLEKGSFKIIIGSDK